MKVDFTDRIDYILNDGAKDKKIPLTLVRNCKEYMEKAKEKNVYVPALSATAVQITIAPDDIEDGTLGNFLRAIDKEVVSVLGIDINSLFTASTDVVNMLSILNTFGFTCMHSADWVNVEEADTSRTTVKHSTHYFIGDTDDGFLVKHKDN